VALCVTLFDIGHLKLINDRYSHAAADRAVQQVGTAQL